MGSWKTFVTAQRMFGGVRPLSCFYHVSRRSPLRLPYCPAGARRQHAQRCGAQGLQHHLASVISCAALPVHHFLARPAKPACVARRYRLRFLALDHALDPGGVRHPAQRWALQAEVVQVKGAELLAYSRRCLGGVATSPSDTDVEGVLLRCVSLPAASLRALSQVPRADCSFYVWSLLPPLSGCTLRRSLRKAARSCSVEESRLMPKGNA